MNTQEKVRENRIRRMAKRRGYILSKARRRDPGSIDYGKYALVNTAGRVVYGSKAGFYSADLGDIENFLTQK